MFDPKVNPRLPVCSRYHWATQRNSNEPQYDCCHEAVQYTHLFSRRCLLCRSRKHVVVSIVGRRSADPKIKSSAVKHLVLAGKSRAANPDSPVSSAWEKTINTRMKFSLHSRIHNSYTWRWSCICYRSERGNSSGVKRLGRGGQHIRSASPEDSLGLCTASTWIMSGTDLQTADWQNVTSTAFVWVFSTWLPSYFSKTPRDPHAVARSSSLTPSFSMTDGRRCHVVLRQQRWAQGGWSVLFGSAPQQI